MEQVKKFAPALFALILFCFLLPFLNFSYNGQKLSSLTGLQLITGDGYQFNDEQKFVIFGMGENTGTPAFKDYGSIGILSLLITFLGLVISFIKMKNKSLLIMIVSISGGVLLYLLKNYFDNGYQNKFFIEYEFGYWFAVLLFIVSAVVQGIIFNQERKMNPDK
jgi:hypothetical protein